MRAFRMLLIVAWISLATYTAMTISSHGLNLLPIFFGDIAAGTWPGQFNLDFLCFLTLAALWTAWRNAFTPAGLALGAIAFVGGAGFLLPYLLVLTIRTRGHLPTLLLGEANLDRAWAGTGTGAAADAAAADAKRSMRTAARAETGHGGG